MPSQSDSQFKFFLESENDDKGNPAFNFTTQNMNVWKRVVITDSIYQFFPTIEIDLEDSTGVVHDYIVSLEGLQVKATFGSDEDGYLINEYIFEDSQLNTPTITDHISGNVILRGVSYYELLDSIKSKGFNDTISNIAKNIMKSSYGLTDSNKLFVENTTGNVQLYQINTTDVKFLFNLSDYAYSTNNSKSPYLTFFNCSGEFYFMSIDQLFKQESINDEDYPFRFVLDEFRGVNPFAIQNYEILPGGLDINKNNYIKTFYAHKPDGSISKSINKIENHMQKGDGSLLLRKKHQGLHDSFDHVYFGIYENNELDLYKGFQNNQFRDSALERKLSIIVPFNPNVRAGKICTLEVGSNIEEKAGKSSEWSGKWLIIKSKHFYDVDQVPYSVMELGRSRIKVDPNHPFKSDLLK